jgi:hypothetical protein
VVPGVVQHAALRGQLRADLDAGALGGLEVPCDLISQPSVSTSGWCRQELSSSSIEILVSPSSASLSWV